MPENGQNLVDWQIDKKETNLKRKNKLKLFRFGKKTQSGEKILFFLILPFFNIFPFPFQKICLIQTEVKFG